MAPSIPAATGAWRASSTAASRAGTATITASTVRVRPGSAAPPMSMSAVAPQRELPPARRPAGLLAAPPDPVDGLDPATPRWMVTPRSRRAEAVRSARLAVLVGQGPERGPAPGPAGRWTVGLPAHHLAQPPHQAPRLVGGRQQQRKGGCGTEIVDPSGVDAADQRVDEPFHHRSSQPLAHDRTHRAVAEGRCPSAGGGWTRSLATRTDSPGLRIPDRNRGHHRVGTPRLRPSGIMRSRPRAQIEAPWPPTGTSCPSRPNSAHRSVASGRRARKASAARSTRRPANSAARSLPPTRSTGLEDVDLDSSGPAVPPAGQLPGGGQTGDPAADDRDDRPSVRGHARAGSCVPGTPPPSPAAGADHAGQQVEEGRVVVQRRGAGEGHIPARRPPGGPRCRGRRGPRGGPRRTPPGRPAPRWRPPPPPAASRPAGRGRSKGRPSGRRSARPPPSSGRGRCPGRGVRRHRRPSRPPGPGRGHPRPPPGGGGCGR